MENPAYKISEIASDFGINDIKNVKVCNTGHINGTFFADSPLGPIVIQQVNKGIFSDVPALMDNVIAVCKHIENKMLTEGASSEEISRGVLKYFPTADGKYYTLDDNGEYWRISRFIESSATYNTGTPALLCESGYSFGKFQSYLSDFPAKTLTETIPFFHDTAVRFAHFEKSVSADAFCRASKCPDLIEKVFSYKDTAGKIVSMLACGELPLRVIHNDTKLNNILFDLQTGKGLCVIDLDTVMPGTLLYDFGDAIRSGASAVPEGSRDFGKTVIREDLYKAFYEGFSRGVGSTITKSEKENLPLGAFMMTYEVGMRFLDDYLSGDTYFRTEYEGQNLDRARGQLLLADDIMKKMDTLRALTKDI